MERERENIFLSEYQSGDSPNFCVLKPPYVFRLFIAYGWLMRSPCHRARRRRTKTKDEKNTCFEFFAAHDKVDMVYSCNVGLELLDRDPSFLCQNEAAAVTSREDGTTFGIACLIRITALPIPQTVPRPSACKTKALYALIRRLSLLGLQSVASSSLQKRTAGHLKA